MRKRIFIWAMLLTLLASLLPAALAAGTPEVTRQPEQQIVTEGGKCTFRASASGDTSVSWRMKSPDGRKDLECADAGKEFKGLKITGKTTDKLTLSKIPGEMDGWLFYCRYTNKAGKTDTKAAALFVTDQNGLRVSGAEIAPAETPAPEDEADEVTILPQEGELILKTIGCSMRFIDGNGKPKGKSFTELNFGEAYYNSLTRKTVTDGSVDVRVDADVPKGQKVAYWVINGAKYTFNADVKNFTLREVPYSMTIEAVFSKSDSAQTLPSALRLQQQRTGDPLVVKTKSARMRYVNDSLKASGSYFTELDFTSDFTNPVTKRNENGGRVTVQVAARVPEDKVVSYWRFNGARLNFNSKVTSFVVEDLSTSMLYQPLFHTKTTPVPTFTVSCTNCVFSGGGYTNAKSGAVPYGTKITVTPKGASYSGYWTGTYTAGAPHNSVSSTAITWTVKKNCSFRWNDQIN